VLPSLFLLLTYSFPLSFGLNLEVAFRMPRGNQEEDID